MHEITPRPAWFCSSSGTRHGAAMHRGQPAGAGGCRAPARLPRLLDRRPGAAIIGIALLLLSVVLAGGCHRSSAQQQVRAAIDRAAGAVRDRDAGTLGDVLSKDLDTPGHDIDRTRLLGMLRLARLRNEKVRVLMGPVRIEPRGKRLVAHFTVTLGGGGGLLPRHLGVYRVESAWRREDGDWRCYSATWKRQL